MERLKAVLADKVLDLSIESGDGVKVKIDKIQRFRDFANACQTLMKKYPAIEDELIKMVESGDFDTKVASSRVDTIIRLADTEAAATSRMTIKEPIEPVLLEEDSEEKETVESSSDSEESDADDFPMEVVEPNEEQLYTPEDIDYEELESSAMDKAKEGYVSYEDVQTEEDNDVLSESEISLAAEESELDGDPDIETEPDTVTETMLDAEQIEKASSAKLIEEEDKRYEEAQAAAKRKLYIRRTIQILAIVLAVVALIFIIKFIMVHWQTVLIVAGVLAVLAILFVWLKRKR